ncbi:MAG TPA: 2-succinyl-5-enolpyruvyl-6-hydroxy-3-cyclohexene-1-carboxylic-acid synthase [Mycobacteriales bacterium]|nr:2-succinyl-5-enolpyruvyl-6-hydroxy-3-cyclohexene-1-carboxylic-acid synthase [Mycobacteriales bacterium]
MADATARFAWTLVDELARHGVTDAVLAPGSRSTPVALALAASDRIRLHVRIDERSAAYLALGIARVSNRVVPVLCTSGTAASYFLGAVLEADLSGVPLLVLTADRPPELRGVGANQTVDQVGLYGGAVRWSCDVGVPEERPDAGAYWRSLTSRAVAACLGGAVRPGPVHLNLPLREPLVPDGPVEPAPGRANDGPWTLPTSLPATPPDRLAGLLQPVRRGVLVAGDGLSPAQADAVADFAARAGWPLIAEPHSNARQGAAALRCADDVLADADFIAAHRPDGVVVVGRAGLSRTLLGWLRSVPHVVLDPYGGWWDATRTAEAVVTADPSALADVDTPAADAEWLPAWQAAATTAATRLDALLDASPVLSEPRVAREVADALPNGAALVVGSSMPIRDLDLVMRPRTGIRIVANRGVSGIDGFVSAAQGVALAHDGPTVALCGDLSLLHDVNGLLPGPDRRPDVSYVVINNDGGGIFSVLPQATGVANEVFERLFGTPHGMSLARLATAFDVSHTEVTTPRELRHALAERGGVRLIEVRTDRRQNAELHQQLRAG